MMTQPQKENTWPRSSLPGAEPDARSRGAGLNVSRGETLLLEQRAQHTHARACTHAGFPAGPTHVAACLCRILMHQEEEGLALLA